MTPQTTQIYGRDISMFSLHGLLQAMEAVRVLGMIEGNDWADCMGHLL